MITITKKLVPHGYPCSTKFSTDANNLLRESAFCLIPAAAVFKYLGVLASEDASMKVNGMGDWSVIVEGANTYSADPNEQAARKRMEQIVYRQNGIMIANDYLVNSGGVIFAAQEHMIKTPDHLQIPDKMLGSPQAVERWLKSNAAELARMSEERLEAGEAYREKVMRGNMIELVDLLAGDAGPAAQQSSRTNQSAAADRQRKRPNRQRHHDRHEDHSHQRQCPGGRRPDYRRVEQYHCSGLSER